MHAPSLVVLAGGESRRLGRPKYSVEIGGESLLARALRRAGPLCAERIVVARPGMSIEAGEARLVQDLSPYTGALAGIAAGLAAAEQDWSLVLACDLPFVNCDLLRYMLTLRLGHDLVMPRLDVGDEPLYALYHKRCLQPVLMMLEQGERRLSAFHGQVRVRYVTPDAWRRFDPLGDSFVNVNTPEDLTKAIERVGRRYSAS